MNKQDMREIQEDLDNGKFNQICSNETTFNEYVSEKLNNAIAQERKEIVEMIEELRCSEFEIPGNPAIGLALKQNNLTIDKILSLLSNTNTE